jgi:hypothetical protein
MSSRISFNGREYRSVAEMLGAAFATLLFWWWQR